VILREKPKMASQEVQPAMLQVRHPGIAPQISQRLPLRNMPGLQSQTPETRVKLLAVLQTWQAVAPVQRRQPGAHYRQVLALNW
jgi:hypothetical protein